MPRSISSDRLILTALTRADTADLMALYTDAQTGRFIGGPFDETEAFALVAFLCGHWRLMGHGVYAARSHTTGEFFGAIGLLSPPDWPDVELTYSLAPAHRGCGYGTEAVAAVGAAALRAGASRLVSYIDPHNRPSKALARRLGARHTETIILRGDVDCVFRYDSAAFAARKAAA